MSAEECSVPGCGRAQVITVIECAHRLCGPCQQQFSLEFQCVACSAAGGREEVGEEGETEISDDPARRCAVGFCDNVDLVDLRCDPRHKLCTACFQGLLGTTNKCPLCYAFLDRGGEPREDKAPEVEERKEQAPPPHPPIQPPVNWPRNRPPPPQQVFSPRPQPPPAQLRAQMQRVRPRGVENVRLVTIRAVERRRW